MGNDTSSLSLKGALLRLPYTLDEDASTKRVTLGQRRAHSSMVVVASMFTRQ